LIYSDPPVARGHIVAKTTTSQLLLQFAYTEYAVHRSQRALHLHLFYIVETHRRKGAAKQMLAYLDRMARDEAASALTVSADLQNEPAQQAYLALGFKRREKMGLIFKNSFRASRLASGSQLPEPENRAGVLCWQ